MILAVGGYVANGFLERQRDAVETQKLDQEMLNRAIEVMFFAKEKEHLFGNELSLESRRLYRAHWITTYNYYAQVKLTDDFVAIVMEQETDALDKRIITAVDKPDRTSDQTADGWVAVGQPRSKQHADLNFEIPQSAITGDGRIRLDTIIRARWSVNLRKNTLNTEAHGGLNEIIGLIPAGACAKVVKSEANIRSQTWALIDVVPCQDPIATVPAPASPKLSAGRHENRVTEAAAADAQRLIDPLGSNYSVIRRLQIHGHFATDIGYGYRMSAPTVSLRA